MKMSLQALHLLRQQKTVITKYSSVAQQIKNLHAELAAGGMVDWAHVYKLPEGCFAPHGCTTMVHVQCTVLPVVIQYMKKIITIQRCDHGDDDEGHDVTKINHYINSTITVFLPCAKHGTSALQAVALFSSLRPSSLPPWISYHPPS